MENNEDLERRKEDNKDPFDGEYIGNIWGWRFSFIGLALILAMVALMVYRHVTLGVPFGEPQPPEPEKTEITVDTIDQPDDER